MRTLRLSFAFAFVAALGLASACDVYNPTLPDEPFLCGTEEPRCPDGYVPMQQTDVRCVCHVPGGGPGVADGGFVGCEDMYEENDMITTAYTTVVGAGANNQTITDAKICPGTDVDVYSLEADAQQNVLAICDYDETAGSVQLVILNSSGTAVAMGTQTTPGILRASVTAPVAGTYYVQVRSQGDVEVGYGLQVNATGP